MNKISFGVRVPNSGPLSSIENITKATKSAEEMGFDAIWVHDHLQKGGPTYFYRVAATNTAGDFDTLLATMRVDKKSRGNQLRFVVLDDLAKPVVLAGPSEDDLRAAYDAIAELYDPWSRSVTEDVGFYVDLADPLEALEVVLDRVLATHPLQDAVVAGLDRQVEGLAHGWTLGHGVDQPVREVPRM